MEREKLIATLKAQARIRLTTIEACDRQLMAMEQDSIDLLHHGNCFRRLSDRIERAAYLHHERERHRSAYETIHDIIKLIEE